MTALSCSAQPEKRNFPSSDCACGPLEPGHRLHALEHRAAVVELDLLLREVRGLHAVPEPRLARPGLAVAEHRLEQRRLARAVRADERDMLAALQRERRVVEQVLVARGEEESSTSTTVRPLRAGLRNSKPSVRERRVSNSTSPFAPERSCWRRPICVSFACACLAFVFL